MSSCNLCPRRCGVRREKGERGLCGETNALRIATASIHFGEEPPITGAGGSGTIFVSGCGLRCVFCQNWQISQGSNNNPSLGREVSLQHFVEICRALEKKGAENINIVTGSHFIPQLARNIEAAKAHGVKLPFLWNSSAYETTEALETLSGLVDAWLPDLKTLNSDTARRYFNAPDYPEAAEQAILWMIRNSGQLEGPRVIIRHLVLPGHLDDTRAVLSWFSVNAAPHALLSVMTQYTPVNANPLIPQTFLSQADYDAVLALINEFHIDDGFYQELETGSDWLPDFTRRNPFSSKLSQPVWHWRDGFV